MVKKKKIKVLNVLIFIIIVVLLVIILKPVVVKTAIRIKGYSSISAELLYKNNLTKKVLDNDYSKTIDQLIISKVYEDKYIDKYYEIDYVEGPLFNNYINMLLDKGYLSNEVNKIYTKTSKINIEYLSNNKVDNIEKYIDVDIYKPDRIERYVNSFNNDYSSTILYVNMDRDKKYFENPNVIETYSTSMLVNKHNKLVESYTPDLVKLDKCSTNEHYLTKEAKEAYDELCTASLKEGYKLDVTSSYRSYQLQVLTENYYLKLYGQKYVDNYVAVPGYSEHQTGLALDVKSMQSSPFKTTKEYTWMMNNAYKYGFILRYPEKKEEITGYNPESWHFRYVGKDIASYIFEKGITFDEYYSLFLDK